MPHSSRARGRLIESGSHGELLARGGAYAKLYALQFAHEEPAGVESMAARRARG